MQIYTISGKVIKTISKTAEATGYRSEPIAWDGRDEYGDRIGKGVYLYKLKIKTEDGSSAEQIEKLVIIN